MQILSCSLTFAKIIFTPDYLQLYHKNRNPIMKMKKQIIGGIALCASLQAGMAQSLEKCNGSTNLNSGKLKIKP